MAKLEKNPYCFEESTSAEKLQNSNSLVTLPSVNKSASSSKLVYIQPQRQSIPSFEEWQSQHFSSIIAHKSKIIVNSSGRKSLLTGADKATPYENRVREEK